MGGARVQDLFTTGTYYVCYLSETTLFPEQEERRENGRMISETKLCFKLWLCWKNGKRHSQPQPMLPWHPRGVWRWLDNGCYHCPRHCNTAKHLWRRETWFLLYIFTAVDGGFKVTEGSAMLCGLLENASALIQERPCRRWTPGIPCQAPRLLWCASQATCLGWRARPRLLPGNCLWAGDPPLGAFPNWFSLMLPLPLSLPWGLLCLAPCEVAGEWGSVGELLVPHRAGSIQDGSCMG